MAWTYLSELVERHGFTITDTGGGLEQLLRSSDDGESWLIITSADGEVPTMLAAPCTLGRYTVSSEVVVPCHNLVEALALASVLDV